ncbi:MAG: 3'-5' exonuclease domain-containing protein 2 [Bacteroidales bacterium]|nr:3'-5' exonuclease domain-containing protein 2 [Bacteroidales bacterium]MBD5294194.1 3'-5' exonuclease domain-containing protein 2 [Bacteroides sp.]MBD5342383.1 3'-5' exonuclease domain-containing protein 2 [Bacteroides sp.]MBD5351976.1 3'-5' exonuclease domain-containing protein 2 [Bacteroides sp.]MBD5360243.1 3'-5' exonuclease domain-containing protein 2 [Bacteroides sp.]
MEQDQLLKTISKEELAALSAEQFKGRIVLVQSESMAEKAMRFLLDQPIVGFDTETRPSFKKGQVHKVALIQLSTPDTCFLIRLNQLGLFPLMKEFLESESVKKIGLSTKDDFTALNRLAPVQPKGFIELQKLVKTRGIGEASLTKIYALLFGKRISKAQRLTNWEATELTEAQQRYAALDAWACLKIYDKLINS